jgi:hypothetical protein
VTSEPFVNFTLAILRSAELGFLGVTVPTLTQTPRLKGFPLFAVDGLFFKKLKLRASAGVFDFFVNFFLDFLTSCCICYAVFVCFSHRKR